MDGRCGRRLNTDPFSPVENDPSGGRPERPRGMPSLARSVIETGRRSVVCVQEWAEVRAMRTVQGLSIKEIARRTGHARNTIRAALRRPRAALLWPAAQAPLEGRAVCLADLRAARRGADVVGRPRLGGDHRAGLLGRQDDLGRPLARAAPALPATAAKLSSAPSTAPVSWPSSTSASRCQRSRLAGTRPVAATWSPASCPTRALSLARLSSRPTSAEMARLLLGGESVRTR